MSYTAYLGAVLTDFSVGLLLPQNETKPHSACMASGCTDKIEMMDENYSNV